MAMATVTVMVMVMVTVTATESVLDWAFESALLWVLRSLPASDSVSELN